MGGITGVTGVFFLFAFSTASTTHLVAKSGGHVFYVEYPNNSNDMKKVCLCISIHSKLQSQQQE